MDQQTLTVLLTLLALLCAGGCTVRTYQYCRSIFEPRRRRILPLAASAALNAALLLAWLLLPFPTVIYNVLLYLLLLLEFLTLFRGKPVVTGFAAGTLLFHLINTRMCVLNLFAFVNAIYRDGPVANFHGGSQDAAVIFLTLLIMLAFLEVFQRADRQTVRLLIKNTGQLRFVVTSHLFINVYLLVLSVSFDSGSYTLMSSLFFLSTSLLLFGAFYTAFRHGVKMSVLIEYKIRSHSLEQQLRQSQKSIGRLQQFAFTDELTEISNRRYGLQKLEDLLSEKVPFCICFIDIDHLKRVNDTFGHEEGDRYILAVVKELTGYFHSSDTFCRMGGDEFMVLLARCPMEEALRRLSSAQRQVQALPLPYEASFSYGVVEVPAESELSASQVLRQADERMYAYKQAHRTAREELPGRLT